MILTIVTFLFVLGVLIFVHELGHFLAARRLGIKVLTFSLGFGPKLFSVKRGDTEYCVSVIPLGGYVKMAGENPEDSRSGAPDEFLSRSKWERFQVLIMGAVMNLILAVVVLAVVIAQGDQVLVFYDQPPVVGVVSTGSPAAQVGIQPGDRILSFAGEEVQTWEDLMTAVGTRASRESPIVLQRGGQTLTFQVQPKALGRFEWGEIGVLPDVSPSINRVVPGEPAEKAGIQPGDVFVAIDGERVVLGSHLVEMVSASPEGKARDFTIRRNGREMHVSITPVRRGDRAMIGVSEIRDETKPFQPGAFEAVRLSVERNVESSGLIFRMLGGLFTGETSVRQLQGPVGIAQLSGETARLGWLPVLSLMAMLSLNLGILNLMPVPVLDGGHILIMALEGVARRDFSMAVKEKMLLAGFVVLMTLMVTVIYNDLTRVSWIARLMPWRN